MRPLGTYLARHQAEGFRNLLAEVYGEDGQFAVTAATDRPRHYDATTGVEKHHRNFQLLKRAFDAGLLAGQGFTARGEQAEAEHRRAAAEGLEKARADEAERAFVEQDFGDLTVEGGNGWQHVQGGEEWSRVFFVENPDGGDSIRHTFTVRFKKGSAEVVESCWG